VKLERVDLVDIRQFAGQQTIAFSTDANQKITLIHGPNTAGKTTLLNAVYWCFYGNFLSGFNEPERLKSDQSREDEYSVEVRFEHRGKHYIARRGTRGQPTQASLIVLEQRPNGQSIPHPQPELLIGSILPEVLAAFFFFAGEMIEKGLSTGAYQKGATDAIRSVLGLKLAEQAIEDLKDIRKKKQRELQTLSAGTDLARVSTELSEAEQYVESRSEQLLAQRTLITQLEMEKRKVFDNLRGIESSSTLQQRRDKVEAQLKLARAALSSAVAVQQELVSATGTALFMVGSAKQASAFINDAVTKKRIPSPFDKTFVQDILNSKLCVCERPVMPGSSEYRAIASLINDATDETTIRRALAVRGISERVSLVAGEAGRAFSRIVTQLTGAQDQVEALEQDQARIRDLLQRHEAQNVRELENQLEGIESTLRDLIVNKQKVDDEIESKRLDITRLRTELERAQAASPQVEKARTGLELIEVLIGSLEMELKAVEAQGIARITSALNRVVGNSTRQKYSAEVTQEYAIKLYKTENGTNRKAVLVLSSGERRLLDLCFVSALVAVCRDRESETNSILLPGAVAPLMVDAPFGELDPEYQALAAETMMTLSDQLILMLSKTHRTPDVDRAIRPFIGKEYLLIGYHQGPALRAASVQIDVAGRVYEQMIFDAEENWTEIRAIGRTT
jgi:DNA sulfur modification protein DndD